MSISTLNDEFSRAKKRHIANTCFLYELNNVREKLEQDKGVKIPMFLMRKEIEREASIRVVENVRDKGYSEVLEYYNKAYESILA